MNIKKAMKRHDMPAMITGKANGCSPRISLTIAYPKEKNAANTRMRPKILASFALVFIRLGLG